MFKLVVLSALVAIVAAKPSLVQSPLALAAIPAAVSHTSRVDVHSSPVIAAYSSPVVAAHGPLISSYAVPPVVSSYAAAPLISSYAALPAAAVSHSSRVDVHSNSLLATAPLAYSGLGYAEHLGYAGNLGYAGHLGYAHAW